MSQNGYEASPTISKYAGSQIGRPINIQVIESTDLSVHQASCYLLPLGVQAYRQQLPDSQRPWAGATDTEDLAERRVESHRKRTKPMLFNFPIFGKIPPPVGFFLFYVALPVSISLILAYCYIYACLWMD